MHLPYTVALSLLLGCDLAEGWAAIARIPRFNSRTQPHFLGRVGTVVLQNLHNNDFNLAKQIGSLFKY